MGLGTSVVVHFSEAVAARREPEGEGQPGERGQQLAAEVVDRRPGQDAAEDRDRRGEGD
jgi:hypothetical protein